MIIAVQRQTNTRQHPTNPRRSVAWWTTWKTPFDPKSGVGNSRRVTVEWKQWAKSLGSEDAASKMTDYHFIPGRKGSGVQVCPTHSLWDQHTLLGQWVSLTQSGKLTSNTARLRGDSVMQFSVWTLSMTALGPNVKRLGIATTILRTASNRGNGCRATLHIHNRLQARVALFLTHWTIQSFPVISYVPWMGNKSSTRP